METAAERRSARLAIADPPYPPFVGLGGTKRRASRWYGDRQLAATDQPADLHPDAGEWDMPARHRLLLEQCMDEFDGFAIATSWDGIGAYSPLPVGMHVMVWVKPNAMPSSGRVHNKWEPVLLFAPRARRSSRGGVGVVPDVLIEPKRNDGFAGAKPEAWTHWLLEAMTYDPDTDTVADLFPGSGSVSRAIRTYDHRQLRLAAN